MNFIKSQYQQAWIFFKIALARRLLICTVVFLALCAVFTLVFREYAEEAQQIINEFMMDIAQSGVLDENGELGALPLLGNNLRASLVAAAMGIVPFLFLPGLAIAINAAVIGALLGMYSALGGSVFQMVALGLVPHGIFEIPAIMLGVAMGLYLCSSLNKAIRKKPDAPRLEEVLPQLVRQAVCILLPLLILAACIETYVTPLLLNMMY